MTTEERRYIIFEHYHRRRRFNDIAAEMGIDPSTISHDRNRHKEEWELAKDIQDLVLKSRTNEILDKYIDENYKKIVELQSCREDCQKRIVEMVENPGKFANTSTEEAAMIKEQVTLEAAIGKKQSTLCRFLASVLEQRYKDS